MVAQCVTSGIFAHALCDRYGAMGLFDAVCGSESSANYVLSQGALPLVAGALRRSVHDTNAEANDTGVTVSSTGGELVVTALLACMLRILLAAAGEEAMSPSDVDAVTAACVAAWSSFRIRRLVVCLFQARCSHPALHA